MCLFPWFSHTRATSVDAYTHAFQCCCVCGIPCVLSHQRSYERTGGLSESSSTFIWVENSFPRKEHWQAFNSRWYACMARGVLRARLESSDIVSVLGSSKCNYYSFAMHGDSPRAIPPSHAAERGHISGGVIPRRAPASLVAVPLIAPPPPRSLFCHAVYRSMRRARRWSLLMP